MFLTLDPFYEGGAGGVMGRITANVGFLRALLAADPFDAYHFCLPDQKQVDIFRGFLAEDGRDSPKIRCFPRLTLPQALAREPYHCAHLSDCSERLPALARLRRLHAPQAFPVTGVTHTLSYSRYAPQFLAHLWPGASAREAIVATSQAGLAMVRETFAWLREGVGLEEATHPGPQLAQIPLGVDPALFPPPSAQTQAAARARLGLPQDRWTLLCFGRLSAAHKYDVVPLLRALQRGVAPGAGMIAGRVTLVLAGWEEEEGYKPADIWAALARNLGLHVLLLKKPHARQKRDCFLAADCFVSPSDSIQETFGLTLLEAGLAGLPVVASDFDGYRDLVVHEETGLLTPTVGFPDDQGLDALAPLLADDLHLLLRAQQTALDVPALAGALLRLYRDRALGARLGAAGRQRVLARFGWPAVVAQYCALWERMWQTPEPTRKSTLQSTVPAHPLQFPYARLFAGHPSAMLSEASVMRRSRLGEAVYRGQDHPQHYESMAGLPDRDILQRLLVLCRASVQVGELVQRITREGGHAEPAVRFCLHWALKQDLLERLPDQDRGEAVFPDA